MDTGLSTSTEPGPAEGPEPARQSMCQTIHARAGEWLLAERVITVGFRAGKSGLVPLRTRVTVALRIEVSQLEEGGI
jgi:hypothetical protein